MYKKHKGTKEGKSLRMFFFYAITVLFLIIISLSIKAIFVYRQSKFDGKNIAILVSHKNKTVGVLGINTVKDKISLLKVSSLNVSPSNTGRELGIISDAQIDSNENIIELTPDEILARAALPDKSVKTNLTIIDSVRLMMIAKSHQGVFLTEEITVKDAQGGAMDETVSELFRDELFVSENVSIQIINATEIPGLGKELERMIVNRGGNVVAVTSSRDQLSNSVVQYEDESYTVKKIMSLFRMQGEKISEQKIADVIILIGNDYMKPKIL
jgi:Na+-translocating ferredoxin:NAD+ oxidoreductase RnfG subunit